MSNTTLEMETAQTEAVVESFINPFEIFQKYIEAGAFVLAINRLVIIKPEANIQ